MGSSKVREADPLLVIIETSKQKTWWGEQVEKSKKENIKIAKELRKLKYKNKKEKEKWFRKAELLENCKLHKNFFIDNEENRFVELDKRCKSRVCRVCSLIRQMNYFDQFYPYLKKNKIARRINHDGLRLLTLTIKNQKNLTKGIDKIYKAFTKFKRRKYINEIITKKEKKKRIRGGIGSFHIKKGIGDKTSYNHHIHLIIDSSYLDMKSHKKTGEDAKLVREWKSCTGEGGVLDIRKIKDHKGSLYYILNYLSQGFEGFTPKEKAIFFKATSGRRLIFTFGSFYGIKKPAKSKRYQYLPPGSEEYELAEAYFGKHKSSSDKYGKGVSKPLKWQSKSKAKK